MKVVTAGVGLRAGHVLAIMKEKMPEIEFVGYHDPQPAFLSKIGEDVPPFDSVEEMLRETKPDLFFVGSPNNFHLEHIKAGLAAGVRVFTEKPVVISEQETLELAALLKEHGPDRVMVGLVLRYSKHMSDLRAVLGQLGPVVSLEANEHIGPYHGAFFMRDWRRLSKLSGGFMLEKCCHDLDIFNMMTGSRPVKVASFGGKKSYLPEYAPAPETKEDGIMHTKESVWKGVDDAFRSDSDIIDHQTAILQFETGASMAFHTNLNVPDEHRRFCVMGARGMIEGDFVRGYLKATLRDGSVIADHDYNDLDEAKKAAHYGADDLMVADVAAFLRGEAIELPVGIVDALEAGLVAIALDKARVSGEMVDMSETWAAFDAFGLRGST